MIMRLSAVRGSLPRVFALFLVVALAAGCGSSRDEYVYGPTPGPVDPVVQTGELVFSFVQAQQELEVPGETLRLAFEFFESSDTTGPVIYTDEQPYAPIVTVEGVPATANSARVTALGAGGVPLAVAAVEVQVVPNAVTQVDTSEAVVVPVVATQVTVTPGSAALEVGDSRQFSASVTFSNGTTLASAPVEWSATGAVTVDGDGLATAVEAGEGTVTGTLGEVSDQATVTVNAEEEPGNPMVTLTVSPATATVEVGQELQLDAEAEFQNGDIEKVNTSVVWTASAPSVTVLDGLVQAASPGSYTVTATDTESGLSDSAVLTVQPAPDYLTGFEAAEGFTTGSVHEQNDWRCSGNDYDQGIVEVADFRTEAAFASFGSQALRMSNAVTTGQFGNQLFAAALENSVGETAATAGAFVEGTRYNHFVVEFDFATTTSAHQPGLFISMSPDRGDGSRMSHLGFTDKEDGVEVGFYDVSSTGPTEFGYTVLAPALERDRPHRVRLEFTAVEGDGQTGPDIVRIYLNEQFVHQGTSWEDYYRHDPEAEPESTPRLIKTMILRMSGTAAPANLGGGFLFDNFSMSAYNVDPDTLVPVP